MSTTLYRYFDANDELLYVGISGKPLARQRNHERHKDWWPDVVSATFEHHPDRESAARAEREAIIIEQPRHNVVRVPPISWSSPPPEPAWMDEPIYLDEPL